MALNLTKKQYETEMARGEALNRKYGSSSTSNRNTSTGNTGGGSRVSSGGSSGGGSSFDSAAYYAQIQAQAAAEAERLRAQQEQVARGAYDRNMAALQDAYNQRATLLKNNYDSTVGSLKSNYNLSKNNVNNQSNQALQEAYINRMLSQKNLAQNMAAQGLSGGMAESTMAGLYNNYGNARNGIEESFHDKNLEGQTAAGKAQLHRLNQAPYYPPGQHG